MEHFTPSEAPIHETQRLPAIPPRQLVGRNQELGQVYAQIRAGMPVLLHGPAGIGKTTLAAMIATAYTTFKGGVLWWRVGEDSLAQLLVRLGRAYSARALTEGSEPLAHLNLAADLLQREHKPLIVLEDMQDLDVAREFVRHVASSVPMIITAETRASGPWVPFEVGPLAAEDARTLFVQTAQLAGLDAGTLADVDAICAELGGIPLELMMVAQHVKVTGQPTRELLAAIQARRDVKLPGLAAVFAQLPDALKGVLLNLGATYSGGATTALLEYLQLAPAETITRVMDMLVTRGLAYSQFWQADIHCHGVHPLVKVFARQWLAGAHRLETAESRVSEAVLAYAEQHHYSTRGARAALVAEMPNILALARDALTQGETDTVQRVVAVLEGAFGETGAYGYELAALQGALTQLLESDTGPAQLDLFEGEPGELAGTPILAPSAEISDQQPDDSYDTEPLDIPPAAPHPGAEAPDAMLAELVEDGYDAPDDVENLMDAVLPDSALADFEEQGAAEPEAPTLEDLGTLLDDFVEDGYDAADDVEDLMDAVAPDDVLANFEEVSFAPAFEREAAVLDAPAGEVGYTALAPGVSVALEDLLEASQAARDSGDRGRLATALMMLARAWTERGQLQQAQAAYAEALTLREQSGDDAGLLEVLEALAGISLERADLENAVLYATRAQNLAAQGGDPIRSGHVLALLGDIRLELGDLDQAVETYVDAIEALQAGDDEVSLGVVQAKLGATHMDRGEFTRAVTMLSSAQVIFADAGLTEYEGRVLGNLGAAYGHLGQWAEAESYHREAFAIAQLLDDAVEQERQLANLGYAAQAQDDWDAMQDYYRAALDLAYQTGSTEWQVRYLDVLGRTLMDNVTQVSLAVMMLQEAEQLQPDPERQRLLNRASKRLDRLEQSGIIQEAVPSSLEEWAAGHSV